jgi:hypothetical protein
VNRTQEEGHGLVGDETVDLGRARECVRVVTAAIADSCAFDLLHLSPSTVVPIMGTGAPTPLGFGHTHTSG